MSNDLHSDLYSEEADGVALPATNALPRPLWHWPEVAAAVGAPVPAGGSPVTGVSIDTRTLNPGDLFIALSGDPGERFFTSSPGNRDGHEFLPAAHAQGAAGALVSRSHPLGLPQLRTADTLDGLWSLGRAAAARHSGLRVAITGSSGKTTAKAFLAAALGANAETGSLNNFWGVPLCLARTPVDARYAVFEIGTNQVGEIAPLSELVQPHVACLLNVHPAHLGNFPSFQALREEKLSISSGLQDISKFVCEHSVAVAANLTGRVLSFGEDADASVRLTSQHGDAATYQTPAGQIDARVPGGGRHRALTLACVVATLVALDKDPALASELPATLVPEGRGDERLVSRANGGEWLLINDSYNANPSSMSAALLAVTDAITDGVTEAAGVQPAQRTPTYAFLGEMLELGDESAKFHLELLEHCARFDGVFCVGKDMRALADALPREQQLGYADAVADIDLAAVLKQLPRSGQVLVKGSNRVFWQSGFVETLAQALQNS